MKNRVGIIGPEDLVHKATKLMDSYPMLQGIPLPYGSEQEAVGMVKRHYHEADLFLFTGYVPYKLVLNENLGKPLFYFSIAGTSLNQCLFNFVVHEQVDVSTISIDTISATEVGEMYQELDLDLSGVRVNETTLEHFRAEEYYQFHLDHFNQGLTTGAITSINSVAKRLQEVGVPVQRLIPTSQGMQNTLRLIVTFVEGEQARGKQLVLLMAQAAKAQFRDEEWWNETGRWLEQEGKRYRASVFWNSQEIIVLLNQRLFDKYTAHGETAIPLTQALRKQVGDKMVVGIGMGSTMLDAEDNARAALELARKTGADHIYIINQAKEVVGPLSIRGGHAPLYQLASTEAVITDLAERTGLSVKTLSKVLNLYDDSGTEQFSSKVIKDGLGITLRSANRILTKLVEAGVAVPVGYEDQVGRGRPRVLYTLNLDTNH